MVNKRIVALSNQLRDKGVAVSIRSTQTACDVWDLVKDDFNRDEMKNALQSVYVKDNYDIEKFNQSFDEVFEFVDEANPFDATIKDPELSSNNPHNDSEVVQEVKGTGDEPAEMTIEDMLPPTFDPEALQKNRIHEKDLLKTDINNINSFDERILDLCRKLSEKIANKRTKRKRRMNSHSIDMPKTIRKNLKNGGKLIKLYQAKPKIHKSRHIFLNDISGSCDWISTWFFTILYGCQKSFDRIESYEFDNKLIETTNELNCESYYESYENIYAKRIMKGMIHGTSDMAKPFKTFLKETRLNHRTVVIILTDCRDWNGKRENGILESAEILKEIVQKSDRVVILNPESKKRWNTPTSCVEDYRRAGAEIFEIKNLDNLSEFITEL